MAILDDRLNFGELALNSGGGLYATFLPNVIDLVQRTDLLDCAELFVEFRVTEAATVGVGTPYVNFALVTADDAAGLTNTTTLLLTGGGGTAVSIVTSLAAGIPPAMIASQLTLNKTLLVPLPRFSSLLYGNAETGNPPAHFQRYLMAAMIQPKAPASTFALGKVSARLVKDAPSRLKVWPGVPGRV